MDRPPGEREPRRWPDAAALLWALGVTLYFAWTHASLYAERIRALFP